MKIEQEVKKAVEQLTAGDKIQLELDRKNNCLKIWKLNLRKIEVKGDKMKEIKKIADLDIGDFVTDGEEWAEVTQSSESGTYIDDKYYAYRGLINDGSLEEFGIELNQLIAVSDFHEGNDLVL